MFWVNETSEAIVASRESILLLLFAADDHGIFGVSNMCGLVMNTMQSFLLMEKMITLESMIELSAHVFLATNTTSMRASNQRTALACPFFAPATRCVLFFSCVCSTRMCAQGRRPAIRPRPRAGARSA